MSFGDLRLIAGTVVRGRDRVTPAFRDSVVVEPRATLVF